MKTFSDAREKLGNRESRKIANNTYLQKRSDGSIAVKLHSTDVVTFHQNGSVVFDSGGWQTVTTKQRMNEFSPVRIWSDKGIWYANNGGGWDERVVYRDGLTYHPAVPELGYLAKFTGQGEDKTQLRKQVQRFADEYMKKLAAGEIPAPSGGDCWGCLMKTDKGEHPMGGEDHMMSHSGLGPEGDEEKYFVPSMIVNAFDAFGAAQVQRWGLAEIWGDPKLEGSKGFAQWATDARSKRMLKRWILRELGMAS